ncbi:hypothetical protein ABK040_011971 [Willaertia magna]
MPIVSISLIEGDSIIPVRKRKNRKTIGQTNKKEEEEEVNVETVIKARRKKSLDTKSNKIIISFIKQPSTTTINKEEEIEDLTNIRKRKKKSIAPTNNKINVDFNNNKEISINNTSVVDIENSNNNNTNVCEVKEEEEISTTPIKKRKRSNRKTISNENSNFNIESNTINDVNKEIVNNNTTDNNINNNSNDSNGNGNQMEDEMEVTKIKSRRRKSLEKKKIDIKAIENQKEEKVDNVLPTTDNNTVIDNNQTIENNPAISSNEILTVKNDNMNNNEKIINECNNSEQQSTEVIEETTTRRRRRSRISFHKNEHVTKIVVVNETKENIKTSPVKNNTNNNTNKMNNKSKQIIKERNLIVGREKESEDIFNLIEQIFNLKLNNNIICVYGTNGQGKTHIVKEITNQIKSITTIYHNLQGYDNKNNAYLDLLNKLQNKNKTNLKRKEILQSLHSIFEKNKNRFIIILDEFPFLKNTYFDLLKLIKEYNKNIVLILITNDKPYLNNNLILQSQIIYIEPYNIDQLINIMINKYKNIKKEIILNILKFTKISDIRFYYNLLDKLNSYLLNKKDMSITEIKSFIQQYGNINNTTTSVINQKSIKTNNSYYNKFISLPESIRDLLVIICVIIKRKQEGDEKSNEFTLKEILTIYDNNKDVLISESIQEIREDLKRLITMDFISPSQLNFSTFQLEVSFDIILQFEDNSIKRILSFL